MPSLLPTALPRIQEKRKILIVEDEALFAADLEERLTKLGYEVCGQADTCEGAISDARSLRPDLVLMDVQLIGPRDGIDAAGEIRHTTGIPVVFLTAHADDATLARIALVEPFGFALKPLDERKLKVAIEVALHRHNAESRLKRTERWLMTTLCSIGDGVIATDLENKVKFLNSRTEAMTGWGSTQAYGRNLADILVLEKDGNSISLTALLDQASQTGNAVSIGDEFVLRGLNGQKLSINGIVSVIRDENHRITGWVIVFRDVSSRVKLDKNRFRV